MVSKEIFKPREFSYQQKYHLVLSMPARQEGGVLKRPAMSSNFRRAPRAILECASVQLDLDIGRQQSWQFQWIPGRYDDAADCSHRKLHAALPSCWQPDSSI
jgi:hypothetical protein